jgi:hypothetical protein
MLYVSWAGLLYKGLLVYGCYYSTLDQPVSYNLKPIKEYIKG